MFETIAFWLVTCIAVGIPTIAVIRKMVHKYQSTPHPTKLQVIKPRHWRDAA